MRRNRPLLLSALAAAALLALLALLLLRSPPRPAGAAPAGGQGPTAAAPEAPPPRLPLRLPAPPAGAAPQAPDAPALFEGRVVSASSGQGLPGAELTFSRGGAADSVRAGAGGAFRFEPPAPGRWLLAAVTAAGHLPFAPEWGHSPVQLLAEPGRQVRGIEIQLAPAIELEGRVVTDEGDPAPGAEVRLLGAAGEAALVGLPDRFTADAQGRFRAAAPEGSVLEARLPGLFPGRAVVDALALVNGRVTLTLGPATGRPAAQQGALRGRVTAGGGQPVAGALVVATSAHAFGAGAVPAAQAATGADGRFRLAGLIAGPYRLSARAEGHAPGSARGLAAAGEGEEVLIELADGGRLRGCVRDAATGAPVAPFTVLVFTRRGPLWLEPQRRLSVLDPAGCYALDDLQPGPAVVVFSAPGRAPSAERTVEVPLPPGEAVLDGALEAGGRLTGLVRDDATGAPLAGARVEVEGSLSAAASTFPVLSEALSGPDGIFTLGGLPRRFSISVAAADHHARVVGGLEVEPGGAVGPIEVRLRPLAPGEEPRTDLAGIGVSLMPRGEGLVVTQVVPGGGAADAGLAPGDVILEVGGRPVAELGFGGSIDVIRGPEGTWVALQFERAGATFEVQVARRLVRG
jgi:hypothetical protein